MDNMLKHPGTELQLLIKEKGLTQKAFSSILGKKVSEVNELLKGKRNITIQRDYLLHQTLGTPIKYWILKQVDYDYSLLDIDEENSNNNPGSVSMTDQDGNREQNENVVEPGLNGVSANTSFGTKGRIQENIKPIDSSVDKSASEGQNPKNYPLDKGDTAKPRGFEQSQETPVQEQENEDDEDFKNRARIFKTF